MWLSALPSVQESPEQHLPASRPDSSCPPPFSFSGPIFKYVGDIFKDLICKRVSPEVTQLVNGEWEAEPPHLTDFVPFPLGHEGEPKLWNVNLAHGAQSNIPGCKCV